MSCCWTKPSAMGRVDALVARVFEAKATWIQRAKLMTSRDATWAS